MNRTVKKGFTLIEIMFVVAIMALLALGTFAALRYLARVRESATRQKLQALDATLELYNSRIREFPTELQELIDGPSKPQLVKRFGDPMASEEDLLDAWDRPFMYTVNPKGTRPPYELYSTGAREDSQIYSQRSQEV